MTKEQVIAMAQAHRRMWGSCTSRPYTAREDEFATLVRNAALEECAELAQVTVCDTHIPTGINIYGTRVAKAIRNLKEPTT